MSEPFLQKVISQKLPTAYRPCLTNCPSPAQQWEEWVHQWIPLLLQASLAFLFQREILQVNIFILKYRLCLYMFSFDPSSLAKIFALLDVWKCHSHPITARAVTQILKIAQQKDERSWTSSSEPSKLFELLLYLHHFWTQST